MSRVPVASRAWGNALLDSGVQRFTGNPEGLGIGTQSKSSLLLTCGNPAGVHTPGLDSDLLDFSPERPSTEQHELIIIQASL